MLLLLSAPASQIIAEHITTRRAAEFVAAAGPCVAATITPQHLLYNRNGAFDDGGRDHHAAAPAVQPQRRVRRWGRGAGGARLLYNRSPPPLPPPAAALFEGGLRPHRYCLPILKAEADRQGEGARGRRGARMAPNQLHPRGQPCSAPSPLGTPSSSSARTLRRTGVRPRSARAALRAAGAGGCGGGAERG